MLCHGQFSATCKCGMADARDAPYATVSASPVSPYLQKHQPVKPPKSDGSCHRRRVRVSEAIFPGLQLCGGSFTRLLTSCCGAALCGFLGASASLRLQSKVEFETLASRQTRSAGQFRRFGVVRVWPPFLGVAHVPFCSRFRCQTVCGYLKLAVIVGRGHRAPATDSSRNHGVRTRKQCSSNTDGAGRVIVPQRDGHASRVMACATSKRQRAADQHVPVPTVFVHQRLQRTLALLRPDWASQSQSMDERRDSIPVGC